ncbi:hypothetical protein, partial [Helicobacter sp. 12S02634-8]|uniref:hypothetical protein n=1 Tax=Helicobacter sp. 12S02634-8 TaxID=1476199 RepID=UPI00117B8481
MLASQAYGVVPNSEGPVKVTETCDPSNGSSPCASVSGTGLDTNNIFIGKAANAPTNNDVFTFDRKSAQITASIPFEMKALKAVVKDGMEHPVETQWLPANHGPVYDYIMGEGQNLYWYGGENKSASNGVTLDFKNSVYQGMIFNATSDTYADSKGTFTFDGSYTGDSDSKLKGYALVGDVVVEASTNTFTFKNDANFKGNAYLTNNSTGVMSALNMNFTNSSFTGNIGRYGIFRNSNSATNLTQTYTFDGNSSSKDYALKGFDGNSSSKDYALKGFDGKNAQIYYNFGQGNFTFKNGAKGYIDFKQDSTSIADFQFAGQPKTTFTIEGSNTLLEGTMIAAGGNELKINIKDNAKAKLEISAYGNDDHGKRNIYLDMNKGTLEGNISNNGGSWMQLKLDQSTITGNVSTKGWGILPNNLHGKTNELTENSLTAIASTIKGNITGDQKAAITLINSDVGDIDESHTASTLTFATKRPTTDSSK